MPNLDVRPEVAAFALLMEARLRANDDKPGWKEGDAFQLMERIHEEAFELDGAIRESFYPGGKNRTGEEAADVANFAMMIADLCGALAPSLAPGDRGAR